MPEGEIAIPKAETFRVDRSLQLTSAADGRGLTCMPRGDWRSLRLRFLPGTSMWLVCGGLSRV